MYEELVRQLRILSGTDNISTFDEAADAIEELSKLANAIPHVCECCVGCELEKKNGECDHAFVLSPKRAMQYLIKPRWIPVVERLPENNERVLIHSGDYVGCGLYTGEFWKDEYHDYVIVTHWMPLPEPPKEET